MRDLNHRVRAAGATFTLIGNGSPEQAAAFQTDHLGTELRLLTDPNLTSHRAMELKRSLWSNVRPQTYWHGFLAWRRGFRSGRVAGDGLQQGGAFVITPTGEVPFSHICQLPEDHADPEAILEALRELQREAWESVG